MKVKFKIYLFAVLTWLIPVLVSFLMYDPQTNSYLPNLAVFKLVMLVILFSLTFLFFREIGRESRQKWASVAVLFLLVCSILDLIVLVGLLKIGLFVWLITILPFYILSFFLLAYLLIKPKKSN